MWIVRLALRRPYTFTVVALLILILGTLSALRMAKDIFPPIDIPIVSVIWQYTGLTPDEMEKRMVLLSERGMTTTVNDIEHIESQSLLGVGVIKVFFYPGTNIGSAVAQITPFARPRCGRCRRHHSAADHPLQRGQRPDPPTGGQQSEVF